MNHCACHTNVLARFISSIVGTQIRAASSIAVRASRNRTAPRAAASRAVPRASPPNKNTSSKKVRRAGSKLISIPHGDETGKSVPDERAAKRLAKKEKRVKDGTWKPDRKSQRPLNSNTKTANTTRSVPQGSDDADGLATAFRTSRNGRSVSGGVGGGNRTPGVRTRFSDFTAHTSTTRGASLHAQHDREVRKRPRTSDLSSEDDIVADILRDAEAPKQPRLRRVKEKPAAPTYERKELPEWARRKNALKVAIQGEAWQPQKRLSPDSLNGIRALHQSDPQTYTMKVLCSHFKVSGEAMFRILRSKWKPSEDEIEHRRQRWVARGEKKKVELNKVRYRKKSARIINSILKPRYEPALRVKPRLSARDEHAST